MNFLFLTLFPEIIKSTLNESILKKALDKSLISFKTFDPKDYLHLKFDLVIAHGFLNRSPPYVELKNIR